jgi:hypothetical protein
MTKFSKLFIIIALAAIIGLLMTGCATDAFGAVLGSVITTPSTSPSSEPSLPPVQQEVTQSLNGVWAEVGGNSRVITISGSTGTLTAINPSPSDRLAIDAVNKGYWTVGGTHWRNFGSTGNLTWSGEWSAPTYNASNPGVAVGSRWVSDTWTLSSDGQTLTVGASTWTRTVNTSLNGVWAEVGGNSRVITISGSSTGTLTAINPSPSDRLAIDAVNKGYWTVGGTHWRNFGSTGNLTWSGEWSAPTYNASNPGVAVGSRWVSDTWTLSSNGQTLTVGSSTWTRQ